MIHTGVGAEEPLPNGGSCLLGSFNLSEYVTDNGFNFKLFERDIPIVVKTMNEVLDEGLPLHPLQIQRDTVKDYRQIGIGIMGLADMLIKLGLKYDTNDALNLCDDIGFSLANNSLKASALLAKENGSYPKCKKELLIDSPYIYHNSTIETFDLIKKYGLRNSQILTSAPTGSLSTMLGISGGIEPIFNISYTRKTESLHKEGEKYYKVYTPIVKEYMEKHNILDEKDLPDYFVTSQTIDPFKRVDMQSVWQFHIDASISSTVNLPNETSIDLVEKLYLYAWEQGLKGLTIYRDGCKRSGVLTIDNSNNESNELKRGDWKPLAKDTIYFKKSLVIGCGSLKLFIGYSPSEKSIQDLYIKKSGSGGCAKNLETTVIGISAALRLGGSIENVEKAFSGVDACPSFASARAKGMQLSKGSYCGSAILNAVKDFLKENNIEVKTIKTKDKSVSKSNNIVSKPKCPECGAEISMIEGCMTCNSCGFSKCN